MSAETVQAVTQIEWVVAPEETPLPPLPIRIAMNATNGSEITNQNTAITFADWKGEMLMICFFMI